MDAAELAEDGSGNAWSVKLDGEKTMFGDKYVRPAGGLNEFTLTLEAGLEDGEKKDMVLEAPDPVYAALLIDQSYAMRRYDNADAMNAGLDSYFNAMKAENQKRMALAEAGRYAGIDKDGDIEAQMEDHLIKVLLCVGYCDYDYVRFKDEDGMAILTDSDVTFILDKTQVTVNDGDDHMKGEVGKPKSGVWGDARIGTAMEAMYEHLKAIPADKRAKTSFLLFSHMESQDYVNYVNIPAQLLERYGPGNYNNYWYTLALVCNVYIDGVPLMGPMSFAEIAAKGRGWFHYNYSANQVNIALYHARLIKELGIKTNVCVVNTVYQHDNIETALASGDIGDLDITMWGGLVGITASLLSSDYPENTDFSIVWGWGFPDKVPFAKGETVPASYNLYKSIYDVDDLADFIGMGREGIEWFNVPGNGNSDYNNANQVYLDLNRYIEVPEGTGDSGPRRNWQTRGILYDYKEGYSPNKIGVYTRFPEDAEEIVPEAASILYQQADSSNGGYAGIASTIQDQISDVFSLPNGRDSVRVYKVPRVPSDLVDGVPAGMDENGRSRDFEWGDPVDITDEVTVSVAGNTIRVKNFDYEQNALTDYNKFGRDAYEEGDYGYKVIVEADIKAGDTFGGNHIRTNVPENSKFLPSTPNEKTGLPDWEDNTELNPDGSEEIALFPLPHVDLQPTNPYEGIVDTMYIYAPQTADILNLVTDANSQIFHDDPEYTALKIQADELKKQITDTSDQISDIMEQSEKDGNPSLSGAAAAAIEDLTAALDGLNAEYAEITDRMAGYSRSTPDGYNNQFVDITYTLKDPDNNTVGTLYIPHGRAYDGENITWDFSSMGSSTTILKSGIYPLHISIVPVQTATSPNGYIFARHELTEYSTGPRFLYDSEDYSATGSLAEGTFKGYAVDMEAAAYLYQMKIRMKDTKLDPSQTVDALMGIQLLGDPNAHMVSWEWACTDGETPSYEENEPGNAGGLWVGQGGVNIINSIPQEAFDDGRVQYVNNILACGDGGGFYIPIVSKLQRSCGRLDKNLDVDERVEQTVRELKDDDEVFGPGLSSVVWEWDCGIKEDCADTDFAEAQKHNTDINGKVRCLIHVVENPMPTVEKSTDTPTIQRGDAIQYDVTAANDSEEENPKHLSSQFSLIDIMPYDGDGLIDPLTNREGSDFSGSLSLTDLTIDFSGAPGALARLTSGSDTILVTTDAAVRTADTAKLLGDSASGNITWKTAEFDVTGKNVILKNIPEGVLAVRMDTILGWGESISMRVSAHIGDAADMVMGDRYHNQARTYTGAGARYSEVVAVTFKPTFISGRLWDDLDGNGLLDAGEPRFANIPLTLYRTQTLDSQKEPDFILNGLRLERVYNFNFDMIPEQVTDENGYYEFEEVNDGIYYIMAHGIGLEYEPTLKEVTDDPSLYDLTSKCEERLTFLPSTDDTVSWIEDILVYGASRTGQNFGMDLIKGTVTVNKHLDQIYYPSGMTDEEKADYQLVFLFRLRNTETNEVFKKTVRITGDNFDKGTASCTFEDVPIGTYELTEMDEAQYSLESFSSTTPGTSWNASAKSMTIQITRDVTEVVVDAKNTMDTNPPGGDENGVANYVNMRIPVSLDVVYSGADPITNTSVCTYKFQASDFADIIVTYDDGTKISLSDGTLPFEHVTFLPEMLTSMMNTKDGNKVTVSAVYSEKGRVVKDIFRVGVNLKPVHKFVLTFNANGSTFSDGTTSNKVNFAYDEAAGVNVVTYGEYKDVANKLLVQYGNATDYGFAGWNTKPDGTGVNYTGLKALNAIGADLTISELTLYAQWTVNVTFDARGGKICAAEGVQTVTPVEQSVLTLGSGVVHWNFKQSMATSLAASKENYKFVEWNTKADGTGTPLVSYGTITEPVTFYAVYYQSDFYYTGSYQTFTAPVDGTYKFEMYGSMGGYGNALGSAGKPGYGGYAAGEITLKANQKLYVYVGQQAPAGIHNGVVFNGGGGSPTPPAGTFFGEHPTWHMGGAGGGATDIRLVPGAWNDMTSLKSRIIVAGGGGGSSSTCSFGDYPPTQGHGGNLTGAQSLCIDYEGPNSGFSNYNTAYGGGQRQGGSYREYQHPSEYVWGLYLFYTAGANGSFGLGATPTCCGGGGGGGWYGGGAAMMCGGGGGSSYILGYPGCDTTYAAYQKSLMGTDPNIRNATMQQGVWAGQGYARITLISRD